MSNKYEDLIKNARMNADCGEHMSPAEVTTLLNVVETTFAALAAENAGLKAALRPSDIPSEWTDAFGDTAVIEHDATGDNQGHSISWSWVGNQEEVIKSVLLAVDKSIETPATDAFLAEVLAQARNEGINYAAGRLAAAFNHGFVDKPLAEVLDVVRMILDTKEDLANSTLPAADGLSGEYAEKFLTEFAGHARKGGEPEEGQSFLSNEDCQALVKAFMKGGRPMSNIDKLALRSTSERDWFEDWFKREFHPDTTGPYIKDQLFFAIRAARAPLLDELEAAEKRIAELERKEQHSERQSVIDALAGSGEEWSDIEEYMQKWDAERASAAGKGE
ncbi:hypothetical protein L380_03940 [Enterobacter roggenkampii MGH 34]|nr:hypothetical protein L380_03940 [Enterobacter roggenkampii MGH 34]